MRLIVQDGDRDKRIDTFILKQLDNSISRSNIQSKIETDVVVNGKVVKKGYRLKAGDVVEFKEENFNSFSSPDDEIKSVKGELNIIEETEDYIVLNKSHGVAVHPGKDNEANTIANYLKYYLASKNEYDPRIKRAGIVHRLDKGVGGLLICAKNRETQLELQKQFENHTVIKLYLAEIESLNKPIPNSELGYSEEVSKFIKNNYEVDASWMKVDGKIQRSNSNRMRMEIGEKGKRVLSFVKLVNGNQVLVCIKTGRMHQIRATLKYLGWVVKNDFLYGSITKNENGVIELRQILLGLQINGVLKVWKLL